MIDIAYNATASHISHAYTSRMIDALLFIIRSLRAMVVSRALPPIQSDSLHHCTQPVEVEFLADAANTRNAHALYARVLHVM